MRLWSDEKKKVENATPDEAEQKTQDMLAEIRARAESKRESEKPREEPKPKESEQPKVFVVPRAVSIEEMFNTINDKLDYILQKTSI